VVKPNVVIIYADDLGYGDLGCYGSENIKTPNLDWLSKHGMKFTNWYSNSPVCSPSRASLLTGKYPGNAGVTKILGGKRGTPGLTSDKKTLATLLNSVGYKTGIFGKWHLGMGNDQMPNGHGFDEFFGFLAGCVDYYSHIFYWEQGNKVNPVHDLWHYETEVWCNGQYLTELITDKAIEFIDNNKDDPFFLYVPYSAPHYPMHAPQKYIDRYPNLPADKQIMAAMISAMDDGIGEIVETLRSNNQFEDTIVFFSSDNGPSTESRNYLDGTEDLYYGGSAGVFRGHKGSLFEGGIREPAIMCYPKLIPKGETSDNIAMMMDIVPTILDGLGIEYNDMDFDGKSLMSMIVNNEKSPHGQVFWEYDGQLAIREGAWKLVLNGKLDFDRKQADKVHLSNLNTDINEQFNLKEQFPSITKRLKKDLETWYVQQIADH